MCDGVVCVVYVTSVVCVTGVVRVTGECLLHSLCKPVCGTSGWCRVRGVCVMGVGGVTGGVCDGVVSQVVCVTGWCGWCV